MTNWSRPRLPTEVCEEIMDWIAVKRRHDCEYHLSASYSPFSRRRRGSRALRSCALVCRAWLPRAQMHLFSNIYAHSSGLSSIKFAFHHKPFLPSYVRSVYIWRDEPDSVLISPLLVPYRMPELKSVRVHYLDLNREHTSLFRFAASAHSLQSLDLESLEKLNLPQLLRFINAFPGISRMCIWVNFERLEYPQQLRIPRPNTFPRRSLRYLELSIVPGMLKMLDWMLKAHPLLDHLKSLTLSWKPGDLPAFYSSCEGVRPLMQYCHASLEEISIDIHPSAMTRDVAALSECLAV